MPEVHIHIHVHQVGSSGLDSISQQLTEVLQKQELLMKATEETNAFLDTLNVYTNRMAEKQAEQGEAIANLAADLDDLIANESLDAATRQRLEEAKATLQSHVAFSEAQAATLSALAARHETPLPEPVTPVEPPAAPATE